MTYRDFIQSRVEMTVGMYLLLFLSENDREGFGDTLKLHVYFGSYHINQCPNDKYELVLFNREYTFDTREEAEKYFWDEFLETEMNH